MERRPRTRAWFFFHRTPSIIGLLRARFVFFLYFYCSKSLEHCVLNHRKVCWIPAKCAESQQSVLNQRKVCWITIIVCLFSIKSTKNIFTNREHKDICFYKKKIHDSVPLQLFIKLRKTYGLTVNLLNTIHISNIDISFIT